MMEEYDMTPHIRILPVAWLLTFGLTAWAPPPTAPVTVNTKNSPTYAHELPSGRTVAPPGTLVGTPNWPTAITTVNGQLAVLANGATQTQSITLYHQQTLVRDTTISGAKGYAPPPIRGDGVGVGYQDFFQGLAATPDGKLYAAGGAANDVLAIRINNGKATIVRRYPLSWQRFPPDQYPYVYQGIHCGGVHKPAGLPTDRKTHPRYFYPDAIAWEHGAVFTGGLLANSVARIDTNTGAVTYLNVGAYPDALAFADHKRFLVVSLWGANSVALVNPRSMRLITTIALGPKLTRQSVRAGLHPIALAPQRTGSHVYVALANADLVVEINVRTHKVIRRFSTLPYTGAASGSYPDALALHGDRLYVANAGNDDVAVIDTHTGTVLGLVPTGWYPTALLATRRSLYIVAGKGLGSGPNIRGQWVGDMMHGLVQRLSYHKIDDRLVAMTNRALKNDGFLAGQREALAARNTRLATRLRRKIHTVVLILRENKTFDEEFGRFPGLGRWADPHLALYGARELPNLYAMARGGALFEDFDADGEVTAQGHQWTTAASDSDFVQRTWAQYYSSRGLQGNPGWTQPLSRPAKNVDPDDPFADDINLSKLRRPATNPWISYPEGRFLFDDLARHHVSFENFGEFIARGRGGTVRPDILASTDARFPGWDRMLLDTQRAAIVDRWIAAHRNGLPRFIYIWLPDDHTAGETPCYYTPDAYVANNDQATGKIIAALSRTPAWHHMVVFITEDDAQSGADHVNAHRTFLLVYGPWVKHGVRVSTHYSQVDMMRTIEAIVRIPPLSQWDQNAKVISGIWTREGNDTPFRARQVQIPLTVNPGLCNRLTKLRRVAGHGGNLLTPAFATHWEMRHDPHYTPTTLLKIPGETQMREEWEASRGRASYDRVMAYLRAYAGARHAPITAFEGQN